MTSLDSFPRNRISIGSSTGGESSAFAAECDRG